MGNIVLLILTLAVGATLGTVLQPGILEIVIVAFALIALAYGYRNLRLRNGQSVADAI